MGGPPFGPGVVYIFFSYGLAEQFRWQQTNGTFRANMILRQGGSGRSQLTLWLLWNSEG